ncbi:hypothetical protein K1719_021020 [Acacia pycnantha]|nr:hypothetical protein K1719_021020 [Acacia pycnantha]
MDTKIDLMPMDLMSSYTVAINFLLNMTVRLGSSQTQFIKTKGVKDVLGASFSIDELDSLFDFNLRAHLAS